MSFTASDGRPVDNIPGLRWVSDQPDLYPTPGDQILGYQISVMGQWGIGYPNPNIFDSDNPTLYRPLTQADIDAAEAAQNTAEVQLRQTYAKRGWILAGTFHYAYDRAPGGDIVAFVVQKYGRPAYVPANYVAVAGEGGQSPEYGTDVWFIPPTDPILAPRTTGHDFFTETLNIDTGPQLLHDMPGLYIPLVALGVAAGAAAIGAAAGESAGVGAGAGAADVGAIDVGVGATAAEGAVDVGVGATAADVGAIDVGVGATAAEGAVDVGVGVGAESSADVVIGDAAADTLATEGTSVVDLADAANIGTVDVGVGAEGTGAAASSGGGSIVEQLTQLYKDYKPYIDTAKNAYEAYKTVTTQQSGTNVASKVIPRPAVSPYAPAQLVNEGRLVDSGSNGILAGLLLFAVVAKARKSRR